MFAWVAHLAAATLGDSGDLHFFRLGHENGWQNEDVVVVFGEGDDHPFTGQLQTAAPGHLYIQINSQN